MNPATKPLFLVAVLAGLFAARLPAQQLERPTRDAAARGRDWRDVRNGLVIPDEAYCDQPRLAVMADGSWVCVLTTGRGREGRGGQHIVACRSADRGRSWSELVDVEPADEIHAASYAVLYRTPFDRLYAVYTYNGDGVTALPGGAPMRFDTQGWLCFRSSDDGGRSWSARRRIAMALAPCDRGNDFGGRVQMFWMIGKPVTTSDGAVVFAMTRLGRYFLQQGEGWFVRSENLRSERDAGRLAWSLLPASGRGLRRASFGSVQEEFNVVPLSRGGLYCVYRTTRGHPAQATSRDGGRTWSRPEAMVYRPGGRIVRHPRACPKVWRCANGKYLFWFHNHAGHDFKGRNPAWVCGGIERDGHILWSQPEVLLYSREAAQRFSYPDLIESGGEYWIAETQKTIARIHRIDASLLEGMWASLSGAPARIARDTPEGPPIRGLSVELWVRLEDLAPGREVVALRGRGESRLLVRTARVRGLATEEPGVLAATLRLELSDGQRACGWDVDPAHLTAGALHHLVFILDRDAALITVVADGILCDGGGHRQFGWTRVAGDLPDLAIDGSLRCSPEVKLLRLYRRALRTCEALGNFRAGRAARR